MLAWLRSAGKVSQRKLRLFACAAVRQTWHLLDARGREAVETAEQFADGGIDKGALRLARLAAHAAYREGQASDRAAYAACEVAHECVRTDERRGTAWGYAARAVGFQEQSAFLRDIFGTLRFRKPPAVASSWLVWNDGVVQRLAEAAYQERQMPRGYLDGARLAILADAVEEAGCTDAATLRHLRGPGLHVRGCHIVDLLLGKS
jgi:hypothetical protein